MPAFFKVSFLLSSKKPAAFRIDDLEFEEEEHTDGQRVRYYLLPSVNH